MSAPDNATPPARCCEHSAEDHADVPAIHAIDDAPPPPAPSFAAEPVTSPDSTIAGSEKRNGCSTPSGAALAAKISALILADNIATMLARYPGNDMIMTAESASEVLAALRAAESDEAKYNAAIAAVVKEAQYADCIAIAKAANGNPSWPQYNDEVSLRLAMREGSASCNAIVKLAEARLNAESANKWGVSAAEGEAPRKRAENSELSARYDAIEIPQTGDLTGRDG